ncbi:MAG: hypothetical protein EU547_06875 [Promethearchaeota archaeon]|nr:MAG: hypothetical protein EU547_06875 [Candidatus Lokiarchaeota archaeon]
MVLGAQPSIYWFWLYWQLISGFSINFFLLFPFAFMFGMLLLIFSSLIIAKICLVLVKVIHNPREGVFERDKDNKDYCHWSLRAVIKKWPIWLVRQLSIGHLEQLVLRVFGVKIGKNCSLHEGWVDAEFIEMGDNIRLGQGSLIMSSLIVQNKLILKKIVLNNDITIGTHSVVFPGTIIESKCIIDSLSTTKIAQKLESNSIYRGSPCKRVLKNPFIQEKSILQEKIFTSEEENHIDNVHLKEEAKELSVPFHLYIGAGIFIIGFSFILPGFLFILYFFGIFEPNLLSIPFTLSSIFQIETVIISLLLPLVFIGLYLFHLFFVALFTRWIYSYVDKRMPNYGVFDRNLDQESNALDYYHFESFLFKYPIFVFIRSPFPWLITWELRFLGSNEVGKRSIIEECYLHSHINLGKDCYLGTYSHISNHIVDGVYGEENLTYFGVSLGNNVVFESITAGFPGIDVGDKSTFLPIGSPIKFEKLLGNGIYSDFPAKKLNKNEKKDILGGIEFDE